MAKYKISQFKANDEAYRLNLILVAIANELHELNRNKQLELASKLIKK